MMQPSRIVKDISLSGIRKMFELMGENSINLGLGEPDFDTPIHIREAAKQALDEGFTHYTVNKGIPELREAISTKLEQDNHIIASPDDVIVTAGASEGLQIALSALVDAGDEVIIPDPGFVSYDASVKLSGGTSVPLKLTEEEEFRITPEKVLDNLTDKTKAVLINSPANPTGSVMTKKDIKGVAEIADDHDIAVISDEIYEKIIYGEKHYSPASYSDKCITINGFSKSYAMTGFRVGYNAANPELTEEMLKVHQYGTACACSISQKAALAALEGPQESIADMVREFRRRRDLIVGRLRDMGISCLMPKGAFYVFPRVKYPEVFVANGLKKDVIMVPGISCGIYGEDHVRLSYATSYDDIREAMDRLEDIYP
ncbi:MAG: pyridoxal phosphate-dependent aminotransferase [Methanobacterium sp.]|nr:pyridoxal phosphate-dependent aminotransferase [Methanobacterium sp.]